MAMVFITHDLSIISYICDELAILYRGKLVDVSDEETGGRWGSEYLLEHLGDEALGDCVLSCKPGGVGTVRYGEKGILQFTVSIKTRGAHGP